MNISAAMLKPSLDMARMFVGWKPQQLGSQTRSALLYTLHISPHQNGGLVDWERLLTSPLSWLNCYWMARIMVRTLLSCRSEIWKHTSLLRISILETLGQSLAIMLRTMDSYSSIKSRFRTYRKLILPIRFPFAHFYPACSRDSHELTQKRIITFDKGLQVSYMALLFMFDLWLWCMQVAHLREALQSPSDIVA